MKYEKFLPVGTVVLLKNAQKKLMIIGYGAKDKKTNQVYDYLGCLYPEGVISFEQLFLFNHEQIEKYYYMGYGSIEEKKWNEELIDIIN